MPVFGPVPSRRLGRSLGINNIPPKTCTYSCVYCQLGRTSCMQYERESFYDPEDTVHAAEEKIRLAEGKGEVIDYLTFVPDGEPTLDSGLGEQIRLLRRFGYRIAVITNSSLLWLPEVRKDLEEADLVSLKIDTILPAEWHATDRPHKKLDLGKILDGIRVFADSFTGRLITETMLVQGKNDGRNSLEATALFTGELNPSKAFISVPVRPPAEHWVKAPGEEVLNLAYQCFRRKGINTELIIDFEGNDFVAVGKVEKNLLEIVSVHPMREDAVRAFMNKAGADMSVVEKLVEKGTIARTSFGNNHFYLRSFSKNDSV